MVNQNRNNPEQKYYSMQRYTCPLPKMGAEQEFFFFLQTSVAKTQTNHCYCLIKHAPH